MCFPIGRGSAAVAVATLMLVACGGTVDLGAISRFGTLADEAEKTSTTMARALYRDCLVAREYGGIVTLGAAPHSVAPSLQSDPVIGIVPPMPTPMPDPSTTAQAPKVRDSVPPLNRTGDRPCESDLETSQRWQAFDDGIFAYVKGLGDVAGVAVAPSADKYKKLGKNLATIGAFKNDTIADAAGTFVADIGDEVLKHEQSRDLRDLVDRSNRDDVFAHMIDAAQTADLGYYGALLDDKAIVDAYFESSVAAERLELLRLLREDGDTPGATEDASLQRTCRGNCARHVELAAHVFEIRDRIANRRSRWIAIDLAILTDLGRVQPFYSTMSDLGRTNGALIKVPGRGVVGFANAVEPYIASLQDDVSALVTATAATPSPIVHAPSQKT